MNLSISYNVRRIKAAAAASAAANEDIMVIIMTLSPSSPAPKHRPNNVNIIIVIAIQHLHIVATNASFLSGRQTSSYDVVQGFDACVSRRFLLHVALFHVRPPEAGIEWTAWNGTLHMGLSL